MKSLLETQCRFEMTEGISEIKTDQQLHVTYENC